MLNKIVRSDRTGFHYRVIGYDEPTILGHEVVILQSVSNPDNIFPIMSEGLTVVTLADSTS